MCSNCRFILPPFTFVDYHEFKCKRWSSYSTIQYYDSINMIKQSIKKHYKYFLNISIPIRINYLRRGNVIQIEVLENSPEFAGN